MSTHITVRMAWHDNRWDGKICRDPAANAYCTGSHSLLSERIARDKQTDTEQKKSLAKLDVLMPEYVPPCFWSSAALSPDAINVVHAHPFYRYKDTKRIKEQLPPYSVFTWPFRLSLNQSQEAIAREGKYPEDLDDRVDRYLSKLTLGESLVFYYLNYDNPVTADDYAYLLVGCARLSEFERSDEFEFDAKELKKLRSGDNMQNLPTRSWSVRMTCDVPGTGVFLPYHDYLEHVAVNPKDEEKLEEMRVTIEEPALLPSFKYVSEHVNNDQCIYLLYKLRRSAGIVKRHGISKAVPDEDRIEKYIGESWKKRGLYPGLGNAIALLADLSEGEAGSDSSEGEACADALRQWVDDGEDVLSEAFELLASKTPLPAELEIYKKVFRKARKGYKDNEHLEAALKKLCLFALTYRQFVRVLFPEQTKRPHPFGGRNITAADIAKNPYLLCENYVASTELEKEQSVDLDREVRTDGPIDYFTIDIGMFPDESYAEPNDELQDLTIAGPERLRAFVMEALRRNEDRGHTFATLGTVADAAVKHPLFYRNKLDTDSSRFISEKCLKHFRERLHVEQLDGESYFYLSETKGAEVIVERCLKALLKGGTHPVKTDWIADYVKGEADELTERIPDFERGPFEEERTRLLKVVLENRLSVVSGRPGSGKTHAIRELLAYLLRQGQQVTVLAPTGKAALRAKTESQFDNVLTIDRWIFKNGLGEYVKDISKLPQMAPDTSREAIENLVIDETSMVNLAHVAVILRALEVQGIHTVKRIVFIGDENQLPPIGCGRPLLDLINYLQLDAGVAKSHWVSLRTNCRQRRDTTILDAAQLFAGKNRYHTELWDRLRAGGQISEFLSVSYWKNSDELRSQVTSKLNEALADKSDDRIKALNLLFGLYDTGYSPGDTSKLQLDNWQMLTPYRAGASGALGLNETIRDNYRSSKYPIDTFGHSDKIIRISNYYWWDNVKKRKELILSNGSIGVFCNHGPKGKKAYFPESDRQFRWKWFSEEDFELAYAITVHKSQGSEFESVFLVIPERRALLSRELIYTAMTRSKGPLAIFIQKPLDENPLDIARARSDLLSRNSSLFTRPMDAQRILEPEKGVRVQSKIEFMIYEALRKHREAGALAFQYEEKRELTIAGTRMKVHPDFTIRVGDKTWYWEHLGMLDRVIYSRDWDERVKGYELDGLKDSLLTTDDMAGVKEEKLQQVIADIIAGTLKGEDGTFSKHHYTL